MTCYIIDIVTIGEQKADEKLKTRPVWEGKRLNVPLGPQPVDIGNIYSFQIAGEDVVQSFDTKLLHREYNFPVELTVEVGGKSFDAKYLSCRTTLLCPIAAMGNQMLQTGAAVRFKPDFRYNSRRSFQQGPTNIRLQGTYIGRLSHDGAGLDRPLAEHSMMEAAISLSTTLTEAGILHEFPGGTLIKLLPSNQPSMMDDKKFRNSGSDGENLRRLFGKSFRVMEAEERFPMALHLGITDPKHGENISIEFPNVFDSADESSAKLKEKEKGESFAMNLSPVALFNYRLWCLATHQSLSGEPEIHDIEPLFEAFQRDLTNHRNEINLKFAKVASRTHPMLNDVLARLGIDVSRGKGKEVEPGVEMELDERGEEQLPAYSLY